MRRLPLTLYQPGNGCQALESLIITWIFSYSLTFQGANFTWHPKIGLYFNLSALILFLQSWVISSDYHPCQPRALCFWGHQVGFLGCSAALCLNDEGHDSCALLGLFLPPLRRSLYSRLTKALNCAQWLARWEPCPGLLLVGKTFHH